MIYLRVFVIKRVCVCIGRRVWAAKAPLSDRCPGVKKVTSLFDIDVKIVFVGWLTFYYQKHYYASGPSGFISREGMWFFGVRFRGVYILGHAEINLLFFESM